MTAEALAQAGGVVGAGGLALLLVARSPVPRLAGLGVWALGLVLVLPFFAPAGHEIVLGVVCLLALLGAAALAVPLVRWPWALAFLALAVAPARVPVTIGDTSANLLLPLYGVIAAGALALGWSLWRDPPRSRELGALAWPLALVVLWFGLSALWTKDVREGAIVLFFYVLPFGVLAVALSRLRWSPANAARLYGLLASMALLFAAIGIWQWVTRDVFWNPRVIVANAYAPFYRVNSVFWDPSIYGRFLVVAILASLAVILFRRRHASTADLLIGAAIVVVWIGLLFSFSQSSFVALVLGVVLAAVLAWRWRAVLAVAAVAAAMIPVGIAAPQLEKVRDSLDGASPTGIERATSNRSTFVSAGLRIARDHPVLGVGIGGFKQAYGERLGRESPPRSAASHTTPVTVVAETGIVGLALFVWLVGAALIVFIRRPRDAPEAAATTRLVAGLGFAAIAVHSLAYNAFFEDPLTWGLLALGALAASVRGNDRAPALESPAGGAEPDRLEPVPRQGEAVRRAVEPGL